MDQRDDYAEPGPPARPLPRWVLTVVVLVWFVAGLYRFLSWLFEKRD